MNMIENNFISLEIAKKSKNLQPKVTPSPSPEIKDPQITTKQNVLDPMAGQYPQISSKKASPTPDVKGQQVSPTPQVNDPSTDNPDLNNSEQKINSSVKTSFDVKA